MMASIQQLLLALLLSTTLPLQAATITLDLKLDYSNEMEYEEEMDLPEGMVKENDVYRLQKELTEKDLPYRMYMGASSLKISESGLVRLGMSVGDYDAASNSSLQLATKDGVLLEQNELVLNLSGGDYASGMWSIDAELKISVKSN